MPNIGTTGNLRRSLSQDAVQEFRFEQNDYAASETDTGRP